MDNIEITGVATSLKDEKYFVALDLDCDDIIHIITFLEG